ncbi:MAG TPA: tetratricopeptide repeat protein [Leptolyngbyaceae cyanobacterium M65_K2018_010]|nr:tetratricopeptide repeat protein [Leptolyngbyaceae cyanobacterium M65_K2018_010]
MTNRHWLTHTERALVVGSGLGTVASIAAQNALLATAPLTVLVAIGLLNRGRVERQLQEAQEKLARQQRQAGHRLTHLGQQVTALPSPEALTNFQRSVMDRNNRTFVRFAQEMQGLRSYVNEQIQTAQTPDLTQIQQDILRLQEQSGSAWTMVQNLTAQAQRLASAGRVEVAEAKLAQHKTDLMQTRVALETLSAEMRNGLTNLQDELAHLERRFQKLLHAAGADYAKAEPAALLKAMAKLVSQEEFNSLASHVKELARQQANLERDLTKIPVGSVHGLAASPPLPPPPRELAAELERLNQLVYDLQHQVADRPTSDYGPEQVERWVSQYLGPLKTQVAQLQRSTQALAEAQGQLTHPWVAADLGRQPPWASDWIMDFPTPAIAGNEPPKLASRQALEQALDDAQHRLLVVWPWASKMVMDADLLRGFTRLLDRGGQLELGWCHRGNPQEGRLVSRLGQRWHLETLEMAELKAALRQLLPLRQRYPDRFKFKVMGTAESYLVCDSGSQGPPGQTYAILSLQTLSTHSAVIPGVEAKLRTTNPQVVQALTQRFQNPAIEAEDAMAFFNRGTTRHDLRDQLGAISDYSQVITLQPNHAVAFNNRGVAQLELNRRDKAEQDFNQAIHYNPHLFAAYCNRGWLRLEQKAYPAAVQDFTKAIELQPQLALAYVYRGRALQELGDLNGAVRDYSDAIACGDPVALPYCYRSAAYESQGDAQRAIADLEQASLHLEAQGDQRTLSSVLRTLKRLQNISSQSSR